MYFRLKFAIMGLHSCATHVLQEALPEVQVQEVSVRWNAAGVGAEQGGEAETIQEAIGGV